MTAPKLGPAALALLPDPTASVRCAEHSRSLTLDPGGTAIAAELLVLVETPLPWPKPVFAHRALGGAVGTFETARGPARTLAIAPRAPRAVGAARGPAELGAIDVLTYWRDGASTRSAGHRAETPDQLARLYEELRTDGRQASSFVDAEVIPPARAVLVCTQGSHDVCCGTRGTRFALEAADAFTDVEVLRVSHTGGHRFAPTGMTLPDGRMWAYLGLGDLGRILDRGGSPEALADRCRGWWGARAGAAQVAEREVFARSGWTWDDLDRSVRPLRPGETAANGVGTYLVETATASWEVDVVVGREVPTISCGSPGGLPAKPAVEYEVVRVERL